MKKMNVFMSICMLVGFCIFLAHVADARGRGGGGGFARGASGGGSFSRSGPAASGGFSSRAGLQDSFGQSPSRTSTFVRSDSGGDGHNGSGDHWDDHDHNGDHDHDGNGVYGGLAVGSMLHSNYVTDLPCDTTVIVDGKTYYHCGSTWYIRGLESGDMVYMITTAPPGY